MDASITLTLDELEDELNRLATETHVAAVVADDEDDPMNRATLDELLAGRGLIKGDATARTFTKSKEVFRNPDVILEERAARERVRDTRRKRIKRQIEKRQRIQTERDAKPIDKIRMQACLTLLGNLTEVITALTMSRYNRFRRTLGDVMVEDIAQDSLLRIAEVLSKGQDDLVELALATMWLQRAPQPYVSADGPHGTGKLLGTIINVIGNVIQETYRANTTVAWVQEIGEDGQLRYVAKDTTLTSFELLVTVAANTRTDVDEMIAKTKANTKPAHESCEPGMREKRLFARMVVDAAIKARGLDWLADMLLDQDKVRTDGAFKWTENADAIWHGFGFPAMNTDSPRLKAEYARKAVNVAFAFLPDVVRSVYAIINDPQVMWHLDVHTTQELVLSAAKYKPSRMPAPMDGGVSLEYTVSLMDDPDAAAKALAMIYRNDGMNS